MSNNSLAVCDLIQETLTNNCYKIVKSDSGRMYFIRPSKSGKSQTAVEYRVGEVTPRVSRMLRENKNEATKEIIERTLTHLHSDALDSEPVTIHNRIAQQGDSIFVDLGGSDHRVIRIQSGRWSECDSCQVLFNRPMNMGALPWPVGGGHIDLLRSVLGMESNDTWWLTVGLLLSYLQERGAYFLGVLEGPSGAGKSTLAKYLGRTIDPRKPQVARMPSSPQDLLVAGFNRHVLSFDNLTPLSPKESAVVCSIATGSGMEMRRLYSDSETSAVDLRRPIILNGNRGLLACEEVRSRAVPLLLPQRSPESRRTDESLEDEFVRHWPQILGALFDLAAAGLKHQGSVCNPSQKVRMLDGATWVERCLQGAGLGEGLFLNAARTRPAEP